MSPVRPVCWATMFLGAALLSFGTSAPAADVSVRFLVTTPAMEPEPDKIYISTATDDWPEKGRPLPRIAERLYELRVLLPADSVFSYKFLREPAWRTVEKDLRGEELANRSLKIPGNAAELVAYHDVARWADQKEAPFRVAKLQAAAPASLATGDEEESSRTGDIRAHPTLLDEKSQIVREVQVYLPPGYEEQRKQRYPVIFMLDGQNLFDRETASGGTEWGLDETLERLIAEHVLPPVIVVAIYNSADRINEYAPAREPRLSAGGQADKFLGFIVGTVKPFIDRTYRTQPEAAHTTIGGSSLGGVFALYAVWKRPEVFSRAAVLSPPCHWADNCLTKMVQETPAPKDVRIWLDIGTSESANPAEQEAVQTACRGLADALKVRGLTADTSLHYEVVPRGVHNESAWGARIGRVLEYLLRD